MERKDSEERRVLFRVLFRAVWVTHIAFKRSVGHIESK